MARRTERGAVAGDAGQDGPVRRCIVSGVVGPTDQMVRFVVGPDGRVTPDVAGRLPGRGFWLSARRDTVKTACEKNLFSKAAKARVAVPPDLEGEIERQLARRCQDLLGFARRAGEVAVGFEKASARIRSGRAGLLVEAADGAPGGKAKVASLAPDLPRAEVLTAAELGAALGRDFAVHVVVDSGAIAEKLRSELARLQGFRAPSCASGTPDAGSNGLKGADGLI